MSPDAVIQAEGLGKRYRLRRPTSATTVSDAARVATARFRERFRAQGPAGDNEWFWALEAVSFTVNQGEVLGLVGPNGAGKSTLLKILARITDPTAGRAEITGRVGSLLEIGTGFHPELTGRENIYLNGTIIGMKRAEIASRFDEIVEFSGIERFIDTPVKFYSSGMYVRLGFAVAAHLEANILLIDEVLAVGDIEFQRRCLGRMDEVAHSGRTIVFVSHNLASVASLCTNGIFLDKGRVAARGLVEHVLERYVASAEQRGTSSLRDRVDRQGEGPMRFTSVDVFGPAGPAVVGQEASVDLGYDAEKELRNVFVSFSVYGAMGEVVAHCSNRLSGDQVARAPASGSFRCSIPRLPLVPGRYSLNLYCEVDGVPSDWVQSAHVFDVLEGDFFGSGHLPPAGHGRVMVDHGWVFVETQAPEISRAEAQI